MVTKKKSVLVIFEPPCTYFESCLKYNILWFLMQWKSLEMSVFSNLAWEKDRLCCKLRPDIQLCLFSVVINIISETSSLFFYNSLTLILRRSRTGTVWFYTSTSNKRAARTKLYTESLTRDLKRMYSRLTLVRISINL